VTQQDLDRAVARSTGESLRTIRGRGFNVLTARLADIEPARGPHVLDWDALEHGNCGMAPLLTLGL